MTRTDVCDKLDLVKGGIKMKELVQSKSMLGLIIFILGAIFLNSMSIKNEMKINSEKVSNQEIVYNK